MYSRKEEAHLIDMNVEIEKARKQILRDKHTLLEGYVAESLFERQFLAKNNVSSRRIGG